MILIEMNVSADTYINISVNAVEYFSFFVTQTCSGHEHALKNKLIISIIMIYDLCFSLPDNYSAILTLCDVTLKHFAVCLLDRHSVPPSILEQYIFEHIIG